MESLPGEPGFTHSRLGRRGFLAGATGVLAAGLAACAGGQRPGSDAPPSPGFPVEIPNKYGVARIPTAAQRIATLGITDHDAVLALGVIPVGITRWGPWPSGVGPWAEPMLRGQRPKIFSSDVDPESVVSVEPDVISAVQSALTSNQYSKLSSINPVVAQPPNSIDYGVSWRRQAEILGQALGKSDEAAQVIAGTQARIDQARAEHPEFQGKTHVTVQATTTGTYAAYTKDDPRTKVLEQLGLRLSPTVEALGGEGKFNATVSKEQVSLLDADVVIVTPTNSSDIGAVRQDKLLNNLPAAKRGSLVLLDDYDLTMALGSATVSSIPYTLDKLVPKLAEALKNP